jgi:RNA polymerase sigma-70 factor (ECF subfamily)
MVLARGHLVKQALSSVVQSPGPFATMPLDLAPGMRRGGGLAAQSEHGRCRGGGGVAPRRGDNKEQPLATRTELSDFLASAERRAFKQASYAVRDAEAALDIVQDAMLRLAEKYGDRPAAELPLLFQRILQNAIRDHFRRRKVRSLWTTLLSTLGSRDPGEGGDPLETLEAEAGPSHEKSPDEQLEQSQFIDLIEQEIRKLPARQREAFLLRYWEELDVAETAAAMGCSQGSVKTHCSRAAHALAVALRARGLES